MSQLTTSARRRRPPWSRPVGADRRRRPARRLPRRIVRRRWQHPHRAGLVIAAHMGQRFAHGTSLAAVVPISIASVITYAAHGNVDWHRRPVAFDQAVAGAVIGTHLLHVLPQRWRSCSSPCSSPRRSVCSSLPTPMDGRPVAGLGDRPRGDRDRHRDPRRPARSGRRHHHGPGDDPAVRHPPVLAKGIVGRGDHPGGVDGHGATAPTTTPTCALPR